MRPVCPVAPPSPLTRPSGWGRSISDMSIENAVQNAEQQARSGGIDAAIGSLRVLLRLHRNHPLATRVLGMLLVQSGRVDEARRVLQRMVEFAPSVPEFRNNLANALVAAGAHAEAQAQWREAIRLDPGFLPGHFGLSASLIATGEAGAAVEAAERGLASAPESRELRIALVTALDAAGRVEEAAEDLARLVVAFPDDPFVRARELHLLNYLPADGERLDAALADYGRCFPRVGPMPIADPDPERPLRIGYLSSDFRTHSVGFFVDAATQAVPAGFEAIAFSTQPTDDADPIKRRLRPRFTEWHEVRHLDDAGLDRLIRERKIDVLIELGGHFAGSRLPSLSRRPAPVIITAIGYPASTGHPAIDVRFVDSITDPPGSESHATERLERLDPCFLCYTPPEDAPEPALPPDDAPITFGSFNLATKISRTALELWSATLAAVPASRMLVKSPGLADAATREALLARLRGCGIEPGRVELLPHVKGLREHLARYSDVHVALDTHPYSGTTTTCEALWMGVPTVTLPGDRHRSRVSASLLAAAGFPELVARDPASFVAIARDLAFDRNRLAAFRHEARERMRGSTLLDAKAYAARFHDAIRRCWRYRCRPES